MKLRANLPLGVILIFLLMFFLLVLSLAVDLEGTDDQGGMLAVSIKPGYHPWVSNPWTPSPGFEKLLFFIQAASGGGVMGWYMISKRRGSGGTGNAD